MTHVAFVIAIFDHDIACIEAAVAKPNWQQDCLATLREKRAGPADI